MRISRNPRKLGQAVLLVSFAGLSMGCGSQLSPNATLPQNFSSLAGLPTGSYPSNNQNNYNWDSYPSPIVTPTPGSGSGSTNPTPSGSPTWQRSVTIQKYPFTDSLCKNPTPANVFTESYTTEGGLSTDSKLLVSVSAGSPSRLPCDMNSADYKYLGYTVEYSCVKFRVSVGLSSQEVIVRRPDATGSLSQECKNAPTSKVVDFSDEVKYYNKADLSDLRITLEPLAYDNCGNIAPENTYYYWPYSYYGNYGSSSNAGDVTKSGCQLHDIYQRHLVTGILKAWTNKSL